MRRKQDTSRLKASGFTIIATYVGTHTEETDNDQPEYTVHDFTNVVDAKGKKLDDTWFKETRLVEEVHFKKGERYTITMKERFSHPIEIKLGKQRWYIKNQNSIIYVNERGEETNLSYDPTRQELGRLTREYNLQLKRLKNQ